MNDIDRLIFHADCRATRRSLDDMKARLDAMFDGGRQRNHAVVTITELDAARGAEK